MLSKYTQVISWDTLDHNLKGRHMLTLIRLKIS